MLRIRARNTVSAGVALPVGLAVAVAVALGLADGLAVAVSLALALGTAPAPVTLLLSLSPHPAKKSTVANKDELATNRARVFMLCLQGEFPPAYPPRMRASRLRMQVE